MPINHLVADDLRDADAVDQAFDRDQDAVGEHGVIRGEEQRPGRNAGAERAAGDPDGAHTLGHRMTRALHTSAPDPDDRPQPTEERLNLR